MVWEILDNKKWEDIPERSVFWILHAMDNNRTKRVIQKSINIIKTSTTPKILRFNPMSKQPIHIKYIPDVV